MYNERIQWSWVGNIPRLDNTQSAWRLRMVRSNDMRTLMEARLLYGQADMHFFEVKASPRIPVGESIVRL